MAKEKTAGLLYGPEAHHLDHLGPLCSLMEIPLIVTDEEIYNSAKRFYPELDVLQHDYLSVTDLVVKNMDILFYSMPRSLFDEIFFFSQKLHNKRVHTIWCPHGNSDKGHSIFFMEALKNEEAALVYGNKMVDFLKSKEASGALKRHVKVGNYRHQYYKRHKTFYDALLKEEITKKLAPSKKTLLFAPTWQDYEMSSSFFDMAPFLMDNLPGEYNLIIKLHPNLVQNEPLKVDKILHAYESHERVLFLIDFPPIYPLLDFVDVYIGDMSSIGYDFLTFDKPMFFLNQNERDAQNDPGLYLFRCGFEIKKKQYKDIYKIMNAFLDSDKKHYSSVRKEVYLYTFGEERPWKEIKKQIELLYENFPPKDLNFF